MHAEICSRPKRSLNKCISSSMNSRELKLGSILDMIPSFQNQVPDFFIMSLAKVMKVLVKTERKKNKKRGIKLNMRYRFHNSWRNNRQLRLSGDYCHA